MSRVRVRPRSRGFGSWEAVMSEDSAQTTGRLSRRAFLKGVGAGGASLAVGPLVARPVFAETPELWLKPGAVAELPAQLHLQFGRNAAEEIVASWSTTVPVARPRLRLGTSPGDLDRAIEAFAKTYTDGLSGTPVLTYHARMHGLRPDTEYHYQVLHDGSQPMAGSFRTPPGARAADLQQLRRSEHPGQAGQPDHAALDALRRSGRRRGGSAPAPVPSAQRRPLLRERRRS